MPPPVERWAHTDGYRLLRVAENKSRCLRQHRPYRQRPSRTRAQASTLPANRGERCRHSHADRIFGSWTQLMILFRVDLDDKTTMPRASAEQGRL
jgi:hypothetical protein